ncbi:MAG: ATP cone domain-containing protein [Patescibacteria group bacterium]
MTQLYVVKADGEREIFDSGKLEASLLRSGANETEREAVVRHVARELADGMTTEEIYRHAHDVLRRVGKHPVAARYSIKRAVFDLGPSGYPFERFFAALLSAEGWKTKTGIAMNGRCAPHEVDVCAEKDGLRVGIEAKFHNTPGIKTDVKDALYVFARFEDLKQAPDPSDVVSEGWLVTNTRFTRTAIRYGRCSGLRLIGWDYPRENSLLDMIERSGLHPITCLTTLTNAEKARLLERDVVLCSTIAQSQHLMSDIGIRPSQMPLVLEEVRALCNPIAEV